MQGLRPPAVCVHMGVAGDIPVLKGAALHRYYSKPFQQGSCDGLSSALLVTQALLARGVAASEGRSAIDISH